MCTTVGKSENPAYGECTDFVRGRHTATFQMQTQGQHVSKIIFLRRACVSVASALPIAGERSAAAMR